MNDREALQQIADIANNQLGQSGGGGGGGAPAGNVAPVTAKPSVNIDLGTGRSTSGEAMTAPGQVVGAAFTTVAGATNERTIKCEGKPGQFWSHYSWCVFDSGGARVLFGDNVANVGTLGFALTKEVLGVLGPGSYTLGVAVNGSGKLAFHFNQN